MVAIGEDLQNQETLDVQQVICRGCPSEIAEMNRVHGLQHQALTAGLRGEMLQSHHAREQQDAHESHEMQQMLGRQEATGIASPRRGFLEGVP